MNVYVLGGCVCEMQEHGEHDLEVSCYNIGGIPFNSQGRNMDVMKQNILSSKTIFVIMIVYTILIIYFMFFGFGRPQTSSSFHEYRYQIIPTGIPLWFPKQLSLTALKLWIFSLGNLLAFVPFGLLISMLPRAKFYPFISIFLLSIVSLEVLQMITYLGSFDIEDIMMNSLGATIGFFSYKIGNKQKSIPKKIVSITCLIIVSSLLLIVFAERFNQMIRG